MKTRFRPALAVLSAAYVLGAAASFMLILDSGAYAGDATVAAIKWSSKERRADGVGAMSAIPCTCRFAGNDYALGQKVCIRGQEATCDRVLNNTSWQFSDNPCMKLSARMPARNGV